MFGKNNSASGTSLKFAMNERLIGAPCKDKMADGRPTVPASRAIVDNFSQNMIYDKLYCRENSAVSQVLLTHMMIKKWLGTEPQLHLVTRAALP